MDLAAVARELIGPVIGNFTSDDTDVQAQIRSELTASGAKTASGESLVTGFGPGRRFELVGHPTIGADGHYLVTRVVHEGHAQAPDAKVDRPDYINRFECIPSDVVWRPERRTRKPRIYGAQTATVTGPMGMNVYTDQHGRVRVRFHWDRSAEEPSGHASCWIRVSQAWAGAGYPGFVFIPRVGMEVIVTFVDGDPDRPLVTGCVYNGATRRLTCSPCRPPRA